MGADTVAYLSLEGLTESVSEGRTKYCTSCYTGIYPVEFPRDEAAYLQLALKLNPNGGTDGPRSVLEEEVAPANGPVLS